MSKETLEIKLIDFGFATYFDERSKIKDNLGSPVYMSPEVAIGGGYNNKTDIWSVGIIVYQLLVSNLPFVGKNNG